MKQRTRATTIRASEIGSYLFCQRAWGYQRSGRESKNQEDMHTGTRLHEAHGKAVFSAAIFQLGGNLVLLISLVLLVIYLVDRFL